MLLYRVYLRDPSARAGASGHPTYLHKPQGSGRWDNPSLYDAWYLSSSAEGAVGESFGNIPVWTDDMLEHPTGLRRTLATFSAPDDLSVFDFDDASNLARIGMRPSQVVTRNKGLTQGRAAELFSEPGPEGSRRWAALRWWSFHRPTWANLILWGTASEPAPLTLADVEYLDLSSTSVVEAAKALHRPLPG